MLWNAANVTVFFFSARSKCLNVSQHHSVRPQRSGVVEFAFICYESISCATNITSCTTNVMCYTPCATSWATSCATLCATSITYPYYQCRKMLHAVSETIHSQVWRLSKNVLFQFLLCRSNHLRVHVYIQEMNYLSVRDLPAYPVSTALLSTRIPSTCSSWQHSGIHVTVMRTGALKHSSGNAKHWY